MVGVVLVFATVSGAWAHGLVESDVPVTVPVPKLVAPDAVFRSGFENESASAILAETARPTDADQLKHDAIPEISVQFVPGAITTGDVRLFVNEIDVTAQADIQSSGIRYVPGTAYPEGRQFVRVEAGSNQHSWNFLTATAPQVARSPLDESTLPPGARPDITIQFSDLGSGIDPDRTRLYILGGNYSEDTDVTDLATRTDSSISFTPAAPLADDRYFVDVEVFDRAGNPGLGYNAIWFQVGGAPQLLSVEPASDDALIPFGTPPLIRVHFNAGSHPMADYSLSVDGEPVPEPNVETRPDGSLVLTYLVPEGPLRNHCFSFEARNTKALRTVLSRCFTIDIERDQQFEILSPQDNAVVSSATLEVRVRAFEDGRVVEDVTINGEGALVELDRSVKPPAYRYHYLDTVALSPGANQITVRVQFRNGVVRTEQIQVTLTPAPTVQIDTPRDWETLGPVNPQQPGPGAAANLTGDVQRPVLIQGSTSAPVSRVEINQQQATLSPDGRSFSFPNFFLHEGTNLISATATDTFGRAVSQQITVYVDQTAPVLTVAAPAQDAVVSTQTVDVRGIANDAVEGRVGTTHPEARVLNLSNGSVVVAQVGNLGFLATDVPLEVGANILRVSAIDALGNRRSQDIRVVRSGAGAERLLQVSGNRQQALAGAELPQPLTVQAVDNTGEPMANETVRFDIVRGSGSIRSGSEPNRPDGVTPARNLSVQTDATGLAQVWLRLGQDARPGSDMVQVSRPDQAEVVVFTASAEVGEAHQIGLFGASGAQYVSTLSAPLEALLVQVLDAADNPVADATVEFQVVSGPGSFRATSAPGGVVTPDARRIRTHTDRNGIAAARPDTGADAGTLLISAAVVRDDDSRLGDVRFQLEVLARRDAATALSGVVMDHDGSAIEGVRLSIGRTALTTLSDASGFFQFSDQVPAGKIDLFVDGRDVQFTRGGSQFEYPALHFESAVIQGEANRLPHPIYLPPVETSRTVLVGGAEDVRLTVPGFEGFEMLVRANSVTFPDGSRIGPLVVSAVHADRLPMVPPGLAGQFAGIGWTIQPTNTRFDPPIQVSIPNTDGLAAGRSLPIFQWDHDLAAFVPMGYGTVSEDGSRIVSDAGSGISKAGWGGGGPPPPPPNDGDNQCEVSGIERAGTATMTVLINGSPDPIDEPIHRKGTKLKFKASIDGDCKDPTISWTFGDGKSDTGRSVSNLYEKPERYMVRASATCSCGTTVAPVDKEVRLYCDLSKLDQDVKIETKRHLIKRNTNKAASEDESIRKFTTFIRAAPKEIKFKSGLEKICGDNIEGGWKIEGSERGAGDISFALTQKGQSNIEYKISDCDFCEPRNFERTFEMNACLVEDVKREIINYLSPMPRSNREQGGIINCEAGNVSLGVTGLSSETEYCKVTGLTSFFGSVAGFPHRHPYFETASDVVGPFCQTIYASANQDLAKANKAQQKVSSNDADNADELEYFGAVGWSVGCYPLTEGVNFRDPLDGGLTDIWTRGSPRCRR
ncbi:hypothetical protein C7S18_09395 [Ahniella affigens]|uniref:PKD domain-containing protein n=1 Tax=Ahniella affigens TaxID=2021234 RepID=A0A2P1PRD8_9GAMM|nr:hypothetical protein C7S18_09395 [Ahniella affigens]